MESSTCATSGRWTPACSYYKLEKLADGEVISPKPDLPNISTGETAGLVRRIARNLVQNTPNVEVLSKFDDDRPPGIFASTSSPAKIIGSDQYSNDMQQNLFASHEDRADARLHLVIPALLQDAAGGWYMKYDAIHYRDVFPEPGARDVRAGRDRLRPPLSDQGRGACTDPRGDVGLGHCGSEAPC